MPRDGSGTYTLPFPPVVSNTTIASAVENGTDADIARDLNAPRPVIAGGSGAASADQALLNFSAEKARQIVTNWDSMVSPGWMAGSFYAPTSATGTAPVAGHAFAGVIYNADIGNFVCEATDLTDPINPTKYIRIMVAGVWGNWLLASGGSGTTGDYTFDNTLTFPPASGQIRFNNATENSTTEIFISHLNALGVDLTGTLSASLKSGYDIFIQDKDEPAKYKIFTANAAPVVSGGDFRITVGLKTAGLDIVSGQRVIISISTGSAVVYDVAQGLNINQMAQGRANIGVTKKSYILNGAMQVSQENGATAGTTSNYYPVDQWFTTISGGTVSFAQVAATTPGGSSSRIRCITTGPASFILNQKLEGLRVADLLLGTASVKSFTVQAGIKAPAGTYTVTVWNGAQTVSGGGTFTVAAGKANTDVVKSVVVSSGLTSGVFPTDNSAALWLQIIFNSATGTFELFDVGLYEGNVAPPFTLPDYTGELALCQRYLYRRNFVGGQWIAVLQAYVANAASGTLFDFPVTMRSTPTVTASAPGTFALAAATGGNTVINTGTVLSSVEGAYANGIGIGASALVAGNATLFSATATAYYQFSARL